jgi:hypothetical protein
MQLLLNFVARKAEFKRKGAIIPQTSVAKVAAVQIAIVIAIAVDATVGAVVVANAEVRAVKTEIAEISKAVARDSAFRIVTRSLLRLRATQRAKRETPVAVAVEIPVATVDLRAIRNLLFD